MPDIDRQNLRQPWAVVVVEGHVAAVCETARSAPASVEAGVWTYDQYRRRGYGTAATAAWTTLVADRTTFYSTSFDNIGSQGIARRLGLSPLGHWWQVHRESKRP
jgi:predicted GNAT family acetyltransferase